MSRINAGDVVWKAQVESGREAEEELRRVNRAATEAKQSFLDLARAAGATDAELKRLQNMGAANWGTGGGNVNFAGGGGGGTTPPPPGVPASAMPNQFGSFRPLGVPRGTKPEAEEAKWGFSEQFRPLGVPRGTKPEAPGGQPSITRAATATELAQVFDEKTAKQLNTSLKDLVENARGIERDARRARNSWGQYSVGIAYAARHAISGGVTSSAGMAAGLGIGFMAGGPAGAYLGGVIGQTAAEAGGGIASRAVQAAGVANPAGRSRLERATADFEAAVGRRFVWLQNAAERATRFAADTLYGGNSQGLAPNPSLGQTFGGPMEYQQALTHALLSQSADWSTNNRASKSDWVDYLKQPFGDVIGVTNWAWSMVPRSQPGPVE